MLGITCSCAERGVLVSAFGPSADPAHAADPAGPGPPPRLNARRAAIAHPVPSARHGRSAAHDLVDARARPSPRSPACPSARSIRSCARATVPTRRATGRWRWPSGSAATRVSWPRPWSTPARCARRATTVEVAGPGFINLTFTSSFLTEQLVIAAPDERLGVRRPAGQRTLRRRLLAPQRRQGDARRPPAHDGHRRLAVPHADVHRPAGDPREPHRRLGHAVRHAHRAPARRRRDRGRPRAVRRRPQRLLPGRRRQVRGGRRLQGAGPPAGRRAAARRRRDAAAVAPARRREHPLLQPGLPPPRGAARATRT